MKESKLLPCPLCGGKATIVDRSVMCQDCYCETDIFDTDERAIQAWNKRDYSQIKALLPKKKNVYDEQSDSTKRFNSGYNQALQDVHRVLEMEQQWILLQKKGFIQ